LRYEQGTQERTLEIALEMLKEGLSNQVISRVTHLCEQEIEALRQKLKRDKK
jgi:DNA-binding NarL/FixJ family response regulator